MTGSQDRPIYGHRWKVVENDGRWLLCHWHQPRFADGGWKIYKKYRSERRARRRADHRNRTEAEAYWYLKAEREREVKRERELRQLIADLDGP